MKAEIDDRGCLTITAETELESYALGCWSKDYLEMGDTVEDKKAFLLIRGLQVEQET